ncbi:MAG: hypothetical protein WBN65_15030 [Gammaproteobacteria bacterium]
MLFLRTIKRRFFANEQFNNYLLYAVGEIVLVIAGILLALQIDTWNSDRQSQAAIDGYLENIARIISEDLNQLNEVKARLLTARIMRHG